MTCNDTSFFNIFSFLSLEHDAMDFCLVYHGITFQKDIVLSKEVSFEKGKTFNQAIFNMKTKMITFASWGPAERGIAAIKATEEVSVRQERLAPFMVW